MKNTILIFLASGIIFTSCKKLSVEKPAVEITLNKTTYKLGDTVTFSMSGNADYVSFYSGEVGKNYDLKDVYTSAITGNPEFQFTSSVQLGNAPSKGLSVLVSSDFNGVYDATNVRSATWTDVTNRSILATSATSVSSGVVNLNDLKIAGKPLYVAYKYVSSNPATTNQWQWTVSAFQFRTKYANGITYTNAPDNATAGFGSVELAGDSARWSSGSTLAHTGLKAGFPADEDWAISRGFELNKVNSDATGVAVLKNISGLPLTGQYQYKYATAGVYKAVFVVRNNTGNDLQEKLITFNITVIP